MADKTNLYLDPHKAVMSIGLIQRADIIEQAREEVQQEMFRALVDKEKARIYEELKLPAWRRFIKRCTSWL